MVIADDSGLEVRRARGRARCPLGTLRCGRARGIVRRKPKVRLMSKAIPPTRPNARLLRELHDVPDEYRSARFVCVIAAARNGHTLATFHGRAEGLTPREARGSMVSVMILRSTSQRSARPSPNSPPQRRPNTATAAPRFANFSSGRRKARNAAIPTPAADPCCGLLLGLEPTPCWRSSMLVIPVEVMGFGTSARRPGDDATVSPRKCHKAVTTR